MELGMKMWLFSFGNGAEIWPLDKGKKSPEHMYIVCLFVFCCFTSQVNSYGHCGTVSSPNHTFFQGKLEQAVNQ